MLKASDIMTKDVVTIRSAATVAEAIALMQARGWRSLIVDRSHDQDAYGMVTETDIVYQVIAVGKDPQAIRVYEIMTKPCITVNPNLGVEYVARLFAQNNLLRAPVIQGELLGIISVSDILMRGKSVEHPQSLRLEKSVQTAIHQARQVCEDEGVTSKACIQAWEDVEDLQIEAAYQRNDRLAKTAFDEFCEEFPDTLRARMIENLCSG
jgi:CBS domain-containing protein